MTWSRVGHGRPAGEPGGGYRTLGTCGMQTTCCAVPTRRRLVCALSSFNRGRGCIGPSPGSLRIRAGRYQASLQVHGGRLGSQSTAPSSRSRSTVGKSHSTSYPEARRGSSRPLAARVSLTCQLAPRVVLKPFDSAFSVSPETRSFEAPVRTEPQGVSLFRGPPERSVHGLGVAWG